MRREAEQGVTGVSVFFGNVLEHPKKKNVCNFKLVTSFKTLLSSRLYCCFKVPVTFIFSL